MLRVTVALSLVIVLATTAEAAINRDSEVQCSTTCVAVECNTVGIRYGKYCGVGWTGCPGEKPCDDLDACCKVHDDCVGKKGSIFVHIISNLGMMDIKCHEKFKRCIKKVHISGKAGFSRKCPYDTVVPTMAQDMDMAIMLSQMGGAKFDL